MNSSVASHLRDTVMPRQATRGPTWKRSPGSGIEIPLDLGLPAHMGTRVQREGDGSSPLKMVFWAYEKLSLR